MDWKQCFFKGWPLIGHIHVTDHVLISKVQVLTHLPRHFMQLIIISLLCTLTLD